MDWLQEATSFVLTRLGVEIAFFEMHHDYAYYTAGMAVLLILLIAKHRASAG
jgi:hypothetical protein